MSKVTLKLDQQGLYLTDFYVAVMKQKSVIANQNDSFDILQGEIGFYSVLFAITICCVTVFAVL